MTNLKIIENGWYAVQVGDEDFLDRGSKYFNDALNIALQYAINDDYNGQQIRIITCDIFEDGSLSLCTNVKIIREGFIPKFNINLFEIKERMLDFMIETIGGYSEQLQVDAENHIDYYANDFTRQYNENYDLQLTDDEINEVVQYIVRFYRG